MGSQSEWVSLQMEVLPEVSHGAKCVKCFHVNNWVDHVNEQANYVNEHMNYVNEPDNYALNGSHPIVSENRLFEYLLVHLLLFYALNLVLL